MVTTMPATENPPTIRVLSLGAGVQSTALLLLAAEGKIAHFDAAVFADTGWEPALVYAHLDRLESEVARPAGIPILRVSVGNIRDDALNPAKRFASMPLFVRGRDGSLGMARRQCTAEYKIKPIRQAVRQLLGYPHPRPVPRGVWAEQIIGISTDERHRANVSDVSYARNSWPLLDLDWSRNRCIAFLESRGWGSTPKSACIGCPYHGNRMWRDLRDNRPSEWEDAVAFDAAIRAGSARANANGQELRGRMYLHRSRVPLTDAPIDRVTRSEWHERQGDLLDLLDEQAFEDAYAEADIPGCSPFACRADALGPTGKSGTA
jgi:hypothetical protein